VEIPENSKNSLTKNGFRRSENHLASKRLPRPLSRELDIPLEQQFRDRRFQGDASRRDRAEDVGSRVP
jgi:hypothetical protein